ncbi:hypothetical protein GCM10027174_28180 [Salinifilum aidingensis]
MTGRPRRLLLLSATIGEGHNATARAVEEAARHAWPDCAVSRVDTLDTMGPGVRRAFNWIYATNVESTPWLYDFFYWALWRYRWFANGCRRFVGAWCGRRLRRVLREHAPDLVVTTYPLGTAGMNWLRRRGESTAGVVAVVSDFAPHPFWVYPHVDMHHVMSEASLAALRRAEPEAVGAACAPPVVSAFHPVQPAAARRSFGFDEDGFTVLVSCGALGFGSVPRAVDAVLRSERVGRVVVVCGRNERLRAELSTRTDPRLVPLGWVDDMPSLTAAADVVLTNAGGATALEALACSRPVLMFEPIAGHGRANAELMAAAGLAVLCRDRRQLTATVDRWAGGDAELAACAERAARHRSGDFPEQVAALAALPRHAGPRPLRPEDAFFVHASTEQVEQSAAAILRLGGEPRSVEAWYALVAERIAQCAHHLPTLRRRLEHRRWLRPRWVDVTALDPAEHLDSRVVADGGQLPAAVSEFLRCPLPAERPPWRLRLLLRHDTGEALLVAKLHHALGDGVAVTSALVRLLAEGPPGSAGPARSGGRGRSSVAAVARGLASLARSGTAGDCPFTGCSGGQRSAAWFDLPSAQVRARARERGVSTTALVLGLVAEALHRQLAARGAGGAGATFRVMVPHTARNGRAEVTADTPGNHTVSVALDLPVGPGTPAGRARVVDQLLRRRAESGETEASGVVLAALGRLPNVLHRWVVRRIYQRRFFHAVVSVMPGRRRPVALDGAPITDVYPLLSLAEGVGVAVGALNWSERVGFGITTDPALAPAAGELASGMREAFAEQAEPSAEREGTAG